MTFTEIRKRYTSNDPILNLSNGDKLRFANGSFYNGSSSHIDLGVTLIGNAMTLERRFSTKDRTLDDWLRITAKLAAYWIDRNSFWDFHNTKQSKYIPIACLTMFGLQIGTCENTKLFHTVVDESKFRHLTVSLKEDKLILLCNSCRR